MQKLLFRRVLRDFRHNLPRYAALFSLMLLSMFLVVSLMGAADSIIQGTTESAEAHGVEHGQFGVFVPLTDSETAQIEASGVTLQKDFSLDLHLDADGSTLRVYAYRDTIDRFAATTGAETVQPGEILLEQHYADTHGFALGSTVTVGGKAFTVTDVVHYASGLYIFMDRDAMQELFGRSDDYYNTVFADHALDIDTGLLYATVSRQNIEQASAVFTDLMMPMVILVSVLSVGIFLVVLYLMIKVMIDRASYSISLLKVFGYCTGEVRRLYLDGNFVVVALGALVCIPAAKGLMDVIYPYFVSNVAAGLELSFPPQLYAVIYAGVLACYLLIDLVLVRRLDRMTPAEVLKNRE